MPPDLSSYFDVVVSEGIYPNTGNLRFYARRLFDDVALEGRSVLEIGGGSGVLSFYAAASGARRVVCLEPEAAGSTALSQQRFEALMRRLRRPEVTLKPVTLQQFEAGGETFDLLLLNASINHLDEEACIRLLDDPAARERYRRIFEKMAALTSPGGHVLATDCSRYNAFGSLGLTSPVARSIDWHKHQTPWLWARLLAQVGFTDPRIGWMALNALREPGRILLGNVVGAFFLASQFRLRMTRS